MRLTKALFYFSDACAWLLAGFFALFAIAYALFGPTVAKFDGLPIPSTLHTVANTFVLALAAIGAWRLTQRQLWGFGAVCFPATLGSIGFALLYLLLVFSIFGTPLVLAFLESRRLLSERSET